MKNKQCMMMLLLLVLVAGQADAQRTRRTPRKPATTSTRPAAAAANAKFAILDFGSAVGQLSLGSDGVYALGLGNDNYIWRVDQQSGATSVVLHAPAISSIYDAIPTFAVYGTTVYYYVQGRGLYRYDGQSFQTSPLVADHFTRGSIGSESYTFCGVNQQTGVFTICGPTENAVAIDLQTGTVLKKVQQYAAHAWAVADGTMWMSYMGNIYKAGASTPAKKAVAEEVYDMLMDQQDGTIYMAADRRIFHLDADGTWRKQFELPEQYNGNIKMLAKNGPRIYFATGEYLPNLYMLENGQLTSIGQLKTGIDHPSGGCHDIYAEPALRLLADNNGNLWYQYNEQCVIIYNPDGIKGLTGLKGKFNRAN